MLAAPNLIAATLERRNSVKGREKITHEGFKRKF
jgi:hypothetical protein